LTENEKIENENYGNDVSKDEIKYVFTSFQLNLFF
jgi:hypothetical protein